MLTTNVFSSNSEKIDEILTELKIDGMKHVSFARTTSEERLVAMCHNEMKNAKARYEKLFNVRKSKLIKTKDKTKSEEQVVRNSKANGANLFLGIEQESGKYSEDVQVKTNPTSKREAISWILYECISLEISEGLNVKLQLKRKKVTKQT